MNFQGELNKLDSAEIRGSEEKGEIIEVTKSDREDGLALWFEYGSKEKRYKMTYRTTTSSSMIRVSCRRGKCKAQAKIKVLNPKLIKSKKVEYQRDTKHGKKTATRTRYDFDFSSPERLNIGYYETLTAVNNHSCTDKPKPLAILNQKIKSANKQLAVSSHRNQSKNIFDNSEINTTISDWRLANEVGEKVS